MRQSPCASHVDRVLCLVPSPLFTIPRNCHASSPRPRSNTFHVPRAPRHKTTKQPPNCTHHPILVSSMHLGHTTIMSGIQDPMRHSHRQPLLATTLKPAPCTKHSHREPLPPFNLPQHLPAMSLHHPLASSI